MTGGRGESIWPGVSSSVAISAPPDGASVVSFSSSSVAVSSPLSRSGAPSSVCVIDVFCVSYSARLSSEDCRNRRKTQECKYWPNLFSRHVSPAIPVPHEIYPRTLWPVTYNTIMPQTGGKGFAPISVAQHRICNLMRTPSLACHNLRVFDSLWFLCEPSSVSCSVLFLEHPKSFGGESRMINIEYREFEGMPIKTA